MEGDMSGWRIECRYCRCPAPKGRCHGNRFLGFYIWDADWRHLANATTVRVQWRAALCWITL